MIKVLITAALILVFLFVFVLIASGMLWVVMRVLRSLFPRKFKPSVVRDKDDS